MLGSVFEAKPTNRNMLLKALKCRLFRRRKSKEKCKPQLCRTASIPTGVLACDEVCTTTSEDNFLSPEANLRSRYSYTNEVEAKFLELRRKDFSRLDEQKCVYLDYMGAALAPNRLIQDHAQMMMNPHSPSNLSMVSTSLENATRQAVLEFFHANRNEYEVIWTANASGALRLVGESYPFSVQGSAFLYAPDCHNSVNGIYRFATKGKAETGGFRFLDQHSLNYDFASFAQKIEQMGGRNGTGNKLLAFPGECNASGLKHNVRRYVEYSHEHGWDVLLDAAAMAPTNSIDMTSIGKPEFLTVSFSKICGYPAGMGCLVAKRSALKKLSRPWFCGGTVRYTGVSPRTILHLPHDSDRHENYEEGTIHFQATAAVAAGLGYMLAIGMAQLERHVKYFSALTEMRLNLLKWDNGAPLVYIPSSSCRDDTRVHSLPVVFLTQNGKLLHHTIVESVLAAQGIIVRGGTFGNPGSTQQLMIDHAEDIGTGWEEFIDKHVTLLESEGRLDEMVTSSASLGFVRISFGAPTNTQDIDALIKCLREEILQKKSEIKARMDALKKK